MSGTRKDRGPRPPTRDVCPHCLRPPNARYPHATDCPQANESRRRRGAACHRSALMRENIDLEAVVRHLKSHLQDPARPPGPVWAAIGEILQPEYLEALRVKILERVP